MHKYTHTRTHTHTRTYMCAECTHEAGQQKKGGVVTGSGNKEIQESVRWAETERGIVWFWLWVEFRTGILLQRNIQSMGVYSMWQGPDGEKVHRPWKLFFHFGFVWCGLRRDQSENRKSRTDFKMTHWVLCLFITSRHRHEWTDWLAKTTSRTLSDLVRQQHPPWTKPSFRINHQWSILGHYPWF